MGIKIVLITLFSMTLLFGAGKSSWIVIRKDDSFVLVNKEVKITHPVHLTGIYARLISVTPYKKNSRYTLIKYFAGTGGTSSSLSAYRMVLFDKKKKEIKIDHIYEVISSDKKYKPRVKWKFSSDKIIIEDRDVLKDIIIKL